MKNHPLLSVRLPAVCAILAFTVGLAVLRSPDAVAAENGTFILGDVVRLSPTELKENTASFVTQSLTTNGITGLTVNPLDRTEVASFYQCIYQQSEGFQARTGWTNGNLNACLEGSVSQTHHDDTLRRINYFRAMAGLPANITYVATNHAPCQKAALMMADNLALSHTPPPSWVCWSLAGSNAANHANIGIGFNFDNYGPNVVSGFIEDSGANNLEVGHRRWLLYSKAQTMGNGSIPTTSLNGTNVSASAIWVIGNFLPSVPAGVTNIMWPSKGFVPYQVVYPRWSFSVANTTADFTNATVTMTVGGTNIPLSVIYRTMGFDGVGDPTIVWEPVGIPTNAPAVDTTYVVTISNVIGAPLSTYTYNVTVIDPTRLNQPVTLTGPPTPSVRGNNLYSFTTASNASQYFLQTYQVSTNAWTEGAEDAPLPLIVDQTSGGYSLRSGIQARTGSKSFHLSFLSNTAFYAADQTFAINRLLVLTNTSQLQFYPRFRFATTNSTVYAELTDDDGVTWTNLYSRSGNGSNSSLYWDAGWTNATVSLGAFANKQVNLRFRYSRNGSTFFTGETNSGVWIDDITVTNALQLGNSNMTAIAATATNLIFSPSTNGIFYLRMQPHVGCYDYEFGPTLVVNAVTGPLVDVTKIAVTNGVTVTIDFTLTNSVAGTFKLLRTSVPGGSLTNDPAATFQSLVPNASYRATTTTGGSASNYFKVQMN